MATLSSTLIILRQGLNDFMGVGKRGTTSGVGNAGGTTLVDATDGVNYQNDYFNYWWALITSGTNDGEVRRVSDFVKSTGTITVESAYTAQVAGSVTYELMQYHPTDLVRWALNQALLEIFPDVRKSILNEDLVAGNALPNGAMEDFITSATLPDYWALVGAGATSAKDTSNKRRGLSSASLVRAGTDCYLHCSQAQWPSLLDMAGETVWFEGWCKTSTASVARLGVSVDGGTPTYSSYHTGGGQYELLRVEKAIGDTATQISFRCYVDTSDATAYWDDVRVLSGRVSTLVLPSAFERKVPTSVMVQRVGYASTNEEPCDDRGETYPFQTWPWVDYDDDHDNDRLLLRFTKVPAQGYRLRLRGDEYLATLSADTDTVRIEAGQLNMLYAYAAYRLYSRVAGSPEVSGNSRKEFEEKAEYKFKEYNYLRLRHAQILPLAHTNWGSYRD